MKSTVGTVLITAALWASSAALGADQASAEEIDVKALAREACSSADIKKKFLDLVEANQGKGERAIAEFEVERDCAHFQLPDMPKHDTADPSPDATHKDGVFDVHYSADGKSILSAGYDGTVRLWDATTGKPVLLRIDVPAPTVKDKETPRPAQVNAAIFVGDGSKIAVAMNDDPVRIFEVATGKQLSEVPPELTKNRYGISPKMVSTSKGVLLFATNANNITGYDTAANAVADKIPVNAIEATSLAYRSRPPLLPLVLTSVCLCAKKPCRL
jgi:WD40 repeat protein